MSEPRGQAPGNGGRPRLGPESGSAEPSELSDPPAPPPSRPPKPSPSGPICVGRHPLHLRVGVTDGGDDEVARVSTSAGSTTDGSISRRHELARAGDGGRDQPAAGRSGDLGLGEVLLRRHQLLLHPLGLLEQLLDVDAFGTGREHSMPPLGTVTTCWSEPNAVQAMARDARSGQLVLDLLDDASAEGAFQELALGQAGVGVVRVVGVDVVVGAGLWRGGGAVLAIVGPARRTSRRRPRRAACCPRGSARARIGHRWCSRGSGGLAARRRRSGISRRIDDRLDPQVDTEDVGDRLAEVVLEVVSAREGVAQRRLSERQRQHPVGDIDDRGLLRDQAPRGALDLTEADEHLGPEAAEVRGSGDTGGASIGAGPAARGALGAAACGAGASVVGPDVVDGVDLRVGPADGSVFCAVGCSVGIAVAGGGISRAVCGPVEGGMAPVGRGGAVAEVGSPAGGPAGTAAVQAEPSLEAVEPGAGRRPRSRRHRAAAAVRTRARAAVGSGWHPSWR